MIDASSIQKHQIDIISMVPVVDWLADWLAGAVLVGWVTRALPRTSTL